MLKGFKEFILKGNVVDLTIGIVIGVSFGNVVAALVKDLITPLIGAIGGTPTPNAVLTALLPSLRKNKIPDPC